MIYSDLRSYLMDPYAMMMHYKRAFKLLSVMKQHSAKVLILGRGEKNWGVHGDFMGKKRVWWGFTMVHRVQGVLESGV